MPSAETQFTIQKPVKEVWEFFLNLEELGKCFAFVQDFRKSGDAVRWTIRSPYCNITKTPFLDVRTAEQNYPKIIFSGAGENLKVAGEASLSELSSGQTGVDFKLTMEVLGALGSILNQLVSIQVKLQLKAFVKAVKEILI